MATVKQENTTRKAPRKRLKKSAVDALEARADRYFVWDSELGGFGVRVSPTGRKTFLLGYRAKGSRIFRKYTLGVFGKITVDEARESAKKLLGKIANGADPATDLQERKDSPTVAEFGIDYLGDVDARKRPSTATEYHRVWKKHVIPALGTRRVASITPADIAKLHRALRKTPYQANRILAQLGAFFTYAEQQGVRPKHTNPAHDVKFFPESEGRERFLSPAEVVKLGQALTKAEQEGLPPAPRKRRKGPKSPATAKHTPKTIPVVPANPYAVNAVRFLLLSGWREGEALTLKWSYIDFQRQTAILPNTKTGKSVRHLGAPACALLTALPRIDGSPYVFPGRSAELPLVNITRTWYAVRYNAGLEDVRLHDLRHSFASAVASGGGSLLVIRSLLGHKDSATTQKYAHLLDDPVRVQADATAGELAGWLGLPDTNQQKAAR